MIILKTGEVINFKFHYLFYAFLMSVFEEMPLKASPFKEIISRTWSIYLLILSYFQKIAYATL